MTLEDLQERGTCQIQSLIEIPQIHIALEFILGHSLCGMSQHIGHIDEILAETLDPKDLRLLNLFDQSLAHILPIGQGTLVLVQQIAVLLLQDGQLLR